MSETTTRRFIVMGRVQGVFFRASTRERALQLGLCGYAKNLEDGSVEVVASGLVDSIQMLERWLWQGPATARVTAVQTREVPADPVQSSGFVTL